ncbi:MAG: hypothetical protein R6W90_11785 [Ignavibacteriaceae bacterium]
MPVCPNCNYEYVPGIKVCPDCGAQLVDELEKPVEYNEEDWQVVFTSGQGYEVDMMKDNLGGAGIDSLILDQKDRNFPAPGDFSVIKLMVKKEDAPAAREFIESYNKETNTGEEN